MFSLFYVLTIGKRGEKEALHFIDLVIPLHFNSFLFLHQNQSLLLLLLLLLSVNRQ